MEMDIQEARRNLPKLDRPTHKQTAIEIEKVKSNNNNNN